MKKILGIVLLVVLFVGCGTDQKEKKKGTEILPAKELEKKKNRKQAMDSINKLMEAGEKSEIKDMLENPKKAY